jgi:hypothetical protein
MPGYYKTLGIPPDCGFRELKKAYYRKAKECHPDRFNNSRAKEEQFKRLVAAFDVLSDPDKRHEYDLSTGVISETGNESGKETRSPGIHPGSIMDTPADDTLEELVSGNIPPPGTTLATLMLDLEKTRVFMTFREGKNLYRQGKLRNARRLFSVTVSMSPGNILYRFFLAKAMADTGDIRGAVRHFKAAVNLGKKRIPPQTLYTVHKELDKALRKKMPWRYKLISFFRKMPERPRVSASEEMIDDTNRAISNIVRKRKLEQSKKDIRKLKKGTRK